MKNLKITVTAIVAGIFIQLPGSVSVAVADSPEEIVTKVSNRLQENLRRDDDFGCWQKVSIAKLRNANGDIGSHDVRTYKTIWVGSKPYSRLMQINGTPLNAVQKAEEFKRRSAFLKAGNRGGAHSDLQEEFRKVKWWDLHKNYDFSLLPPSEGATYVIAYKPKHGKVPAGSRIQRVLNQLKGRVWVDENYNVMRAEAALTTPVKFGWGLFAKISQLQGIYEQQNFQGIWMPKSVRATFVAQIIMLKTERQKIDVLWFNPYPRPDSTTRVAAKGENPE